MSTHKNGRGFTNLLCTVALAAVMLPVGAYAAPQAPVVQPSVAAQGQQAYAQVFEHFYRELTMVGDPGQADAFKKDWEHKFDGKCLYLRAFRSYTQYHHSPGDGPDLADPAQRDKWTAEWEHKFDKTGDFATEAGTDSAIRKMRDSLGQRFDYVMSEKRTKEEHDTMKAQFVGIGVPVDMNNSSQVKLGGTLALEVSEPPKGSPAYGLVHFGDKIVKIAGVPVEGMTIEAATKNFAGKPDTKLTITVERKDAAGKVTTLNFEIRRGYVTDPLSSVVPTGDASIGVPVSLTHRDEIKLGKGFELVAHTPFEGSPSTGKIKDGDLITAVDGKSLDGLTINQAVEKIRGTAGSQVTITVVRKGEPKPLAITITRRAIEQHAVHYKDLDNGKSYIKLDQFEAQNVPKDMANAIARAVLPLASQALKAKSDPMSAAQAARFDALKQLLDNGANLDEKTMPIAIQAREVYDSIGSGGGVILDLRGNPGGDVEVFRKVAAMTLPAGTMMVQAQREPGTDQITIHEDILTPGFEVLADHPEGEGVDKTDAHETPRVALLLPAKMPFVVMTNEYSASASELLSGTLQANHRATIVGKSTIGKGVGQVVIQLPYGRSLHVTDFEFFPGGMTSDWIGIIADVDVDAVAGDKDVQKEAAVAEINKQIAAQAKHASAVEAALKKHHEFFNSRNSERSAEDNKPISEQDPSNLQ